MKSSCVINTALLLASNEVHEEAMKVFYSKNVGVILDSFHHRYYERYRAKFFVDEPEGAARERVRLRQELVKLGRDSREVFTLRCMNIIQSIYPSMITRFRHIKASIT